jgi:hypothetical protein
MTAADTCLGFSVECGTLVKGGLAVVMALVLFVGSVLLLLSVVFGRTLGYLVLAASFFGWMVLFSALWVFGFWSQGLETPVDLGPRGAEPGWVVEAAGQDLTDLPFPEYEDYPEAWEEPDTSLSASVQSVTGTVQTYLAEQANEEAGRGEFEPGAFQTTDFTVQNVRFAAADDVSLAAAEGHYNGGGPLVTLYLRHDSGSVSRYSWMFLIGSTVGLLIHLPLLDRAERRRKDILTGGTSPPWYGPA